MTKRFQCQRCGAYVLARSREEAASKLKATCRNAATLHAPLPRQDTGATYQDLTALGAS